MYTHFLRSAQLSNFSNFAKGKAGQPLPVSEELRSPMKVVSRFTSMRFTSLNITLFLMHEHNNNYNVKFRNYFKPKMLDMTIPYIVLTKDKRILSIKAQMNEAPNS